MTRLVYPVHCSDPTTRVDQHGDLWVLALRSDPSRGGAPLWKRVEGVVVAKGGRDAS